MDDYEWLYFLLIVPFLMFLCCAWYDLHRKPKAARMVPVYVPQTPPPIAMQMVQMVPVPPVQPVQIAYGHLSKPGEQLSREECEAFGVPVGSTYTDGGFADHPEQAYGWVPQGQSAPSPVPWGVRGEYPPPAADPLRNAPPGLAQPAPPPPPMGAVPNGGVTPVQRGAPGPPRPSAPPDVPQLATRAAGFTGAPTAPPAPPARVMGGMGPPPSGMGLNPWGDRATPTPFVGNTADGFDQGARRAAFIGLEVTSTPPHAVQQVDDVVDANMVRQGQAGYSNEQIMAGDLILSVDGRDVQNVSVAELHSMLRGPMHSVVNLALSRRNTGAIYQVRILRHKYHEYG